MVWVLSMYYPNHAFTKECIIYVIIDFIALLAGVPIMFMLRKRTSSFYGWLESKPKIHKYFHILFYVCSFVATIAFVVCVILKL